MLDHPAHRTTNHDAITKIMTGSGTVKYGAGITPNPFWPQQNEVKRRHGVAVVRKLLTEKIESLTEPRFITPHETSECIEAIITMTDSRRILELGCCTGYTTYHMLRAVIGKPGAVVVSVDSRPAYDRDFWAREEFKDVLHFVEGWTPDILSQLSGTFDLVFVDSDHSIEHTEKELSALWRITRSGTIFLFHDVPAYQTPDNRIPPPVREWLLRHSQLEGLCLPSCEQLDCLQTYGPGYPKECNPGLGIFVRK